MHSIGKLNYDYDWEGEQSIEEKKFDELKAMKELLDKNPTLNDAWKSFNEMYKVIEGKNNSLLDNLEQDDLVIQQQQMIANLEQQQMILDMEQQIKNLASFYEVQLSPNS